MSDFNKKNVHPVVGCQALDRQGMQNYDRRWLVVDDAGQWVSEKMSPGLSQVSCEVRMGALVLRAPGMLRLDIPMDVIEDDDSVKRSAVIGAHTIPVVDEGDLAAVWFGNVTGVECRLVKVHPEAGEVRWTE